jgi:hypothetical protein
VLPDFHEANALCPVPTRRINNTLVGGSHAALFKRCIKFSVILAIAVSVYGLGKLTGVTDVDCFAWYSPFATLVRTPIQNTYCAVLRNADNAIDEVIRKGIRIDSVNIPMIGGIIATSAFTLKRIIQLVKKFDAAVDTIVEYAYTRQDLGGALNSFQIIWQGIAHTLASKSQSNDNNGKGEQPDEDDEQQDNAQAGGRNSRKRKGGRSKTG